MSQTPPANRPAAPARSASPREPHGAPAPPSRDAARAADSSEPNRSAPPAATRIERIAKRAHEIYRARGGEHGKALDDWLQAEREIDAEIEREQREASSGGST